MHGISLGYYYGKRQCQPYSCRMLCTGQPAISRVHLSRSQINDRGSWFGNETTCAHAYNIWKWCNGQQLGSAVNSSIDQGEFRAMKTLSDPIAPSCDQYQFCDRMTVSTWTIFKISLLNIVVWRRKEEWEKWHFCYHTLLRLAVFRVAFGHLYESCWS